MAQPLGLVDKPHRGRDAGKRRGAPTYRAVTQRGRDDWSVVDGGGSVIFRGDARVAAMIASRLTRPSR